MRRKLEIGLAVLFVLALIGLLLFRPAKISDNLIVLDPKASPSPLLKQEATLRNVIDRDITYEIEPGPHSRTPMTRKLRHGAVDRIAAEAPVQITFDSGSRRLSTTVFPGKPYSFRYDEEGAVRVYPGSHGREDAADLAPYVPTPVHVVEKMLEMAGVGREDVVYDIGCGDGRMVITAARKYRARGVGIDIDPALVEECRANAKAEGVERLTRFLCMDATKARFNEATVVAVYLLPESLDLLRPLFERDLQPGSRVVSHNYRISGWEDKLAAEDVLGDENESYHKIFLYRR